MLSKQIVDGINEQVNQEFFAWYQYLQMAAWCEERNFPGFGAWLRMQASEEQSHAMRLYDFLLEWGASVELKPLAEPKRDFESHIEIFAHALASEQKVGEQVNNLYGMAFEEKAYAAHLQFQWFVTEQVEEVNTAEFVLDQMKKAGDDTAALLMLDRELGARKAEADGAAEA